MEHQAAKLDAGEHPCPCVQQHEPALHRTEAHHVLPKYAGGQAKKKNDPGFTEIQALCPTGHDAVHMLLDQWAREEAAYLADGGEMGGYEPPPTSKHNHIHHVTALRGWKEFKAWWPEDPFPLSTAASSQTSSQMGATPPQPGRKR